VRKLEGVGMMDGRKCGILGATDAIISRRGGVE
jgi:hypothetical protein